MEERQDLISRQAAIDLVRDVCNAVMSGCNSHYDSEVGDEVYDDILEVNAILTCNKEVRKALKGMPSAQQDCTECKEYDNETKSCPKYCETIRKTVEEAKQERTGRWIPCSERLPEEDVDVLISYRYKEGEGDTSHTDIDITTYGQMYFGGNKVGDHKHWRAPFEYFESNYEVIAWMPLPEPYREGEG